MSSQVLLRECEGQNQTRRCDDRRGGEGERTGRREGLEEAKPTSLKMKDF